MRLLNLPADREGRFVERVNRFLIRVRLSPGEWVEVHLHDPGRLPDLLTPGRRVLLRHAAHSRRKTQWDLLAFRKKDYWCFCHSGYHRGVAEALLRGTHPFGPFEELRPEPGVGEGRLDFLLQGPAGELWLEVKGVTWARDRVGLFPDAPTLRGLRHLRLLTELLDSDRRAGLLFLVFRREVEEVRAAAEVDPAFAEALARALDKGLAARAAVLSYDGKALYLERFVPVRA